MKKIEDFIQQATTIEYGVDNGFDRISFDKEKFAELIVRECIYKFGQTRTEPSLEKYIMDGLKNES